MKPEAQASPIPPMPQFLLNGGLLDVSKLSGLATKLNGDKPPVTTACAEPPKLTPPHGVSAQQLKLPIVISLIKNTHTHTYGG